MKKRQTHIKGFSSFQCPGMWRGFRKTKWISEAYRRRFCPGSQYFGCGLAHGVLKTRAKAPKGTVLSQPGRKTGLCDCVLGGTLHLIVDVAGVIANIAAFARAGNLSKHPTRDSIGKFLDGLVFRDVHCRCDAGWAPVIMNIPSRTSMGRPRLGRF